MGVNSLNAVQKATYFLSERNPHYLHADNAGLSEKQSLSAHANNMGFSNLIFKSSDVFIQSWERGCSFVKRCARIVKMRAQIKTVFQISLHYLRNRVFHNPHYVQIGFSEKPTLSERNPYI